MRKRITVESSDQLYLDFDFDINDVVVIKSFCIDDNTGMPVNDNQKEVHL